MKKLSKVIFVLAMLLMVVLPLSARKAMNVSWEWLLSDPDVTAYRYQLNGEDGEWTVVDGKTSSYTATGLDPYSDYTLYLQCSYDGVNWSVSATSTAYALLTLEPEVVEESEPVIEETVVEASPAEETPVEEIPVEETPVEETAEEEVLPVISTIFTYRGITSNIVVYSDNAALTIPEGTTGDDIALAASAVLAAYPEASAVTYSVADGIVYLTYPAQSDDYLLMALSIFESDAEWYIDMIYASLEAPAETIEEVAEETVEEVFEAAEETVLPLFSTLFSYRGVTSEVNAYSDHAALTVPEGVSEEDIAACAVMLVAAYPEASAVTYSVADGIVSLYYPEQSEEYIEGAYALLETEAKWLIDYLNPVAEESEGVEAVEEATEKVEETVEKVEETVVLPVISTIFTYRGITSNVIAYNDNASITLPAGTTEKDVAECALMLLNAYPEAASVIYEIADGTVYLTYPHVSDEFVTLAVAALESEAKWYIDSIYDAIEAEKVEAEAEVAAVVEEIPVVVVIEEPVPVTTETVEETAETNGEKTTVDAPERIEVEVVKDSPKAEAVKASFSAGFSLGAEFGFKSINEVKQPTILPRFALTLEGQNLVHFGAFGFGLRSDISFVFIPQGRTFNGHDKDFYLNMANWGFDATADLKLMTYINTKSAVFYLGAGMGYSLASDSFTSAHSSAYRLAGFNSAWTLTGVAGVSFRLGNTASLSLEAYGRYFFLDGGKMGELALSGSLGLGFRF